MANPLTSHLALSELTAISPIDGRYRSQTEPLADFFSEYALIRYRIKIEVEYFIALCQLPLPQLAEVSHRHFETLRQYYRQFTIEQALAVKALERTTNHDVKAVEYFLKQKFDELGLTDYAEFLHFGLTSQDINNTATPLLLKDAIETIYLTNLTALQHQLSQLAQQWEGVPMLARTHGQPASPTLLGKEIRVFEKRLEQQLRLLLQLPHAAKFGGAVGNLNAHWVSYPQINWQEFAEKFVADLGLFRSTYTTQIESYDHLAALMDNLKRINTILTDMCRDIWTYISMDYFKQRLKAGEIGSSTMPHKINPIDFENAEGNLGIANALFEHFSAKLPISRLQRDLTDSTVLRNLGVPLGHTLLALKNITKGLNKLILNETALAHDLEQHWEVIAEAIQTILRREGYPQPYEALKALTRQHGNITRQSLHDFIDQLNISESVKNELRQITPFNYTGKG